MILIDNEYPTNKDTIFNIVGSYYLIWTPFQKQRHVTLIKWPLERLKIANVTTACFIMPKLSFYNYICNLKHVGLHDYYTMQIMFFNH